MELTPQQRVERVCVLLCTHKKYMRMGGYLTNVKVIDGGEIYDVKKLLENLNKVFEESTDTETKRNATKDTVDKVIKSGSSLTAYADGLNIVINEHFVNLLDDKELAFILLHEAWHIAFKHFFIWNELNMIDPEVTNQAMDYVINLQIVKYDPNEEVCAFPKFGGCLSEEFDGMDTKQVFDILMKRKRKQNGEGEGEGEGEAQSQSGGSMCKSRNSTKDTGRSWDTHGWGDVEQLSSIEEAERIKKVDERNRHGDKLIKARGDCGSGGDRDFDELFTPQLNPYDTLRDFMTALCPNREDSTFARPNRRFISQEIFMPSNISKSIPHVVFANDLSGSMTQKDSTECLTEVDNICRGIGIQKVDILYWDTEVVKQETYEGEDVKDMVNSTMPEGGGGTYLSCILPYMDEKQLNPNVLIVFTDGYVENIEKWRGTPTIFIITSSGEAESSLHNFGSVINLK